MNKDHQQNLSQRLVAENELIEIARKSPASIFFIFQFFELYYMLLMRHELQLTILGLVRVEIVPLLLGCWITKLVLFL